MKHLLLCLLCSITASASAQLIADAGRDSVECISSWGYVLGGNPSASGGVPPYTYDWQPAQYLYSPTTANPSIMNGVYSDSVFYLKVTDANNNTAYDTVEVYPLNIICLTVDCIRQKTEADTVTLSGHICQSGRSFVSYRWSPSIYLSDSTAAYPKCWAPTNISYNVYATDHLGCEYCIGGCSTLLTPNSVDDIEELNLEIYPNPAQGYVKIPVGYSAVYEIMDLSGRTLLDGVVNKQLVDISSLQSGIYFIRVKEKGVVRSNRFIKE